MTKLPAIKAKFKKGQSVYKVKGYAFAGAIQAAFTVASGEWRYVVEQDCNGGLLHIFNGDQLRLTDSKKKNTLHRVFYIPKPKRRPAKNCV